MCISIFYCNKVSVKPIHTRLYKSVIKLKDNNNQKNMYTKEELSIHESMEKEVIEHILIPFQETINLFGVNEKNQLIRIFVILI